MCQCQGGRAGPLSAVARWHVQAWHLQSEQQWLSTVHHQRTPSKEGAACWDTAEISFRCSGTKPCPAVLKQSLPFSSCSRCYSTDTGRRAGGTQPSSPPAGPVPHAAQRRSVSTWPYVIFRRTAWSSWEGTASASSI